MRYSRIIALAIVLAFLTLVAVISSNALGDMLTPTTATATLSRAKDMQLVGHIGGPSLATFVQGPYAYTGFGLELATLSVFNPTHPTRLGYVLLPGVVQNVELAGRYAYVADANAGLRVVDVADPVNPIEIGAFETPGWVADIAVIGHYVCLAEEPIVVDENKLGGGLRIVDVSDPANPVEIGFYGPLDLAKGVTVASHYAYIADGASLRVIDVSNPVHPVQVGYEGNFSEGADKIILADHYAYVRDRRGFWVVDVSDPTHPVSVGDYHVWVIPRSTRGLAISGNYAYVADDYAGFHVINISDPTAMFEVGSYGDGGWSVVIAGSHAYVTSWGGDLRVIDVSNPTAPAGLGIYRTLYYALGVTAVGKYAYVTNGNTVWVIDISNPANPTTVDVYDTSAQANFQPALASDEDTAISGHHAFIISPTMWLGDWIKIQGSLRVVDISNPISPTEVGFYYPPDAPLSNPMDVAESDGYILLADDRDGGLFILRYGFSITGRVTQPNGQPVPGVTISSSSEMTITSETGQYTFYNILTGTYVLTPTLADYTFQPATRTVSLPPDAYGQNFVILPRPVSITLTPGMSATIASLVYTDTQGLPTRLDFSADAVSQTTTIMVTPTLVGSVNGFAFAGHAFELAAYQAGNPITGFNVLVTVTIHYSADDVRVVTDDHQLALWWWNGSGWQDAVHPDTLMLFDVREATNNMISNPIRRVGLFGLFGPTHQSYLPSVKR
jgi:hypothetical protein